MKVKDQLEVIILSSEVKDTRSELWGYLPNSIMTELVLKIARISDETIFQTKKDGKINRKRAVISLTELLKEFEKYNEHFNRRRIVGRSKEPKKPKLKFIKGEVVLNDVSGDPYYRFIDRNNAFDKLVGKKCNIMPKKAIERDRKKLNRAFSKIKKFRDKLLVHSSVTQGQHKPLKIIELEKCLTVITQITNKYYQLLKNASFVYDAHEPDITEPFMKPWIMGTEQLGEIRDKFDKIKEKYNKCANNIR